MTKKDRHKTNSLVRLPPDIHAAMKASAAKNDRTLTAELRRACELYLKRSKG